MAKRNYDKIASLDLDRLQEVLDYDPETGILSWRIRLSPRNRPGQRAGHLTDDGYRRIGIDGVQHFAHHLAWYHFYGEIAEREIDFKNLNKDDIRIHNLRLASRAENAHNVARVSTNSTGYKGVAVFNNPRNRKKYRAQIRANGQRLFLGLFHTPEEAYEAYCKKARELHGEYARLE